MTIVKFRMGRLSDAHSVTEWIGKTDDEKVPPRVRLRLFEQYGGVCQLSGRKIMAGEAWDLDHKPCGAAVSTGKATRTRY
ncbi:MULTISPECIES: hypothetical protein [unclassified Ensifer]|uniref:hypothetical protein n=1 Tax=unclassified Ensifer TaxID=2633371 RepID=UPI00301032D4